MPLILALMSPVTAMVRSSSPIFRWCLSAVSASIITSVGPRGAWPEVISIERRSLCVQLPAIVGAPVSEPMFLLWLSTTVTAMLETAPSASFTPSALATRATTEAGSDSGLPFCGVSSVLADLGLTVTSAEVAAKSLSNVVFIVSVKTRVPHTNATDSRTATAESAIRPLCAKKLRIEVFQTVMRSARARRSPSSGRAPGRRSG